MTTRHPELQMNDLDAEREDDIRREARSMLGVCPAISRADLIHDVHVEFGGIEREAYLFERIAGEVWDEAQPAEVA